MPTETGIYVTGLAELSTAFQRLGGQMQREFRESEKAIAEPVRRDAEALSLSKIRNVRQSPKWSKMRTGATRKSVYVVPRQKGLRRGDDPRKRPRFAFLMMERAMEPALHRNEATIRREMDALLGRVAQEFNH